MSDGAGRAATRDVDRPGAAHLELLASAIAGTPLSVATAPMAERAWTDGATIHLDEGLDPDDQLAAVSVQAALLAAGSLGPEVMVALVRGRSTVARYLAIEGHRALAEAADLLPRSLRNRWDLSAAVRSESPLDSIALARSREPVDAPPELFGAIRPKLVRAEREADPDPGAATHVPRSERRQLLRELDDDEDVDRDGVDTLNPVGGGGALGRLLQKALGTSRSKHTGSPGAEAPTHRSTGGGRVARGAARSRSTADTVDGLEVVRHDARRYPEWNVHKGRYRPDWCTVVEVPAQEQEAGPTQRRAVHGLRRSLGRVGLDLEHRRRQPQGDDIDLDATVQALADLAGGLEPDEEVYLGSVRLRRDLSVVVLLDVSGSAREPSPSGGSVHDHQVATAGALTQALHELGDRVALHGFRSHGRTAVEAVPVKRFDDRFDETTRRRIAALSPGGYTRLGAAVRFGAEELATRGGTMRRLLVVVSDGFAYDHGYEGGYAEADARRALAEARRSGTGCLCLSVGAGTDTEALRRVFGTAAHARLGRTEQLATTAGPLFRSALKLAEVQRMTSQRRARTRERLDLDGRAA